MFVREKKFKNRNKSYLQIVKNYNVEGCIKQKVLLSLGCLQTIQNNGQLKKLVKSFLKYCEKDFVKAETKTNKNFETFIAQEELVLNKTTINYLKTDLDKIDKEKKYIKKIKLKNGKYCTITVESGTF